MWQATRNWYLFGIDIQKRYSLSYSWDSGEQFFIQSKGSFLTNTRNCEQQHNIAVVKSTLKIPPRPNSIIPIMIMGHNLKATVGYFISNQHTNKGLDPSIHVIDGTYNIKGRSTSHILVANYTNKHVIFNKGKCIGHIETSIDHMPQTFIKGLTTLFNQTHSHLPYIPSQVMGGNHWINCWWHLNHNLCRMKQALAQHISQKCKLTQMTQNLSCRGHTPSSWSTTTG